MPWWLWPLAGAWFVFVLVDQLVLEPRRQQRQRDQLRQRWDDD